MSAMDAIRSFVFTGEMTRAQIIEANQKRCAAKVGALANAIQTMSGGRWMRRRVPGGKMLYRLNTQRERETAHEMAL